jgi:hypothetical protein
MAAILSRSCPLWVKSRHWRTSNQCPTHVPVEEPSTASKADIGTQPPRQARHRSSCTGKKKATKLLVAEVGGRVDARKTRLPTVPSLISHLLLLWARELFASAKAPDFNQCSRFKMRWPINFVKLCCCGSRGERHHEAVCILRRAPRFDFTSTGQPQVLSAGA